MMLANYMRKENTSFIFILLISISSLDDLHSRIPYLGTVIATLWQHKCFIF